MGSKPHMLLLQGYWVETGELPVTPEKTSQGTSHYPRHCSTGERPPHF